MSIKENIFINAKNSAQVYLDIYDEITPESINEAVDQVCKMDKYKQIDKNRLIEALELDNCVVYEEGGMLEDKEVKPWLSSSGEPLSEDRKIEWKFWKDYERYLRLQKGWSKKAVESIDHMTTEILMRMQDPTRPGAWDIRGLVVGDVQSGKTSNYVGLINKAADAGYKIIIILAGLHNSLRAQTQERVDSGFVGIDSCRAKPDSIFGNLYKIGVGKNRRHVMVNSFTDSSEAGDFSKKHASRILVNTATNTPMVLVVKKNKSILDNLVEWAIRHSEVEKEKHILKDIPLLLIDDECDNASINTQPVPKDENGCPIDDFDPTAINERIRTFLSLFAQKTYVGYTATPFANILIHRDGFHKKYGDDLFPRNFIINLQKASNYMSPEDLFGIEKEGNDGNLEAQEGLPLIRIVNDAGHVIPDKHKKDLEVFALPESLEEAIKAFLLSCAARRVRGQGAKHNSMLIHVTRYNLVQDKIYELVKNERDNIARSIRYGDGNSSKNVMKELEELWENDFIPTSKKTVEGGKVHEWSLIKEELVRIVKTVEVKQINGMVGDALEYRRHEETGLNVIAIGGDKLSRGLTLEGLTVSYYLRASRMYDTLMQMGRWFGYKPGYADLCRIYTTKDLKMWYRHIALATRELREEFDYMVKNKATPKQYGMRIQAHPGALSVTALNKMRNGTKLKISFDGDTPQTLFIANDRHDVANNFKAVSSLLQEDNYEYTDVGYRAVNVSADKIIKFLNEYKTHVRNTRHKPKYLMDYIRKCNREGKLTDWTVAVLSAKDSDKETKITIPGIETKIRLTKRTAEEVTPDCIKYPRALLSKQHEKLDFTDEEKKTLRNATPTEIKIKRWNDTGGKRALLLLYAVYGEDAAENKYGEDEIPVFGYVISFPRSKDPRMVEYVVDSLYKDEEEL